MLTLDLGRPCHAAPRSRHHLLNSVTVRVSNWEATTCCCVGCCSPVTSLPGLKSGGSFPVLTAQGACPQCGRSGPQVTAADLLSRGPCRAHSLLRAAAPLVSAEFCWCHIPARGRPCMCSAAAWVLSPLHTAQPHSCFFCSQLRAAFLDMTTPSSIQLMLTDCLPRVGGVNHWGYSKE